MHVQPPLIETEMATLFANTQGTILWASNG
jgi:hypothetical protein